MKTKFDAVLCIVILFFTGKSLAQTISFSTTANNNTLCLTSSGTQTLDAMQTTPYPGALGYWWFLKLPTTPCGNQAAALYMGGGPKLTAAGIQINCCGVYTLSHMAYLTTSSAAIDSVAQTFTVFCPSQPPLSISPASASVACIGQPINLVATGATTYSWSNGAIGPAINVLANVNSTYSVIGTDFNGCKNTASLSISVDPCVGFDEHGETAMLTVFPNPASDVLVLINGLPGLTEYCVVDLYGRVILKGTFEEKSKLDASALKSGSYTLIYTTGTSRLVKHVQIIR